MTMPRRVRLFCLAVVVLVWPLLLIADILMFGVAFGPGLSGGWPNRLMSIFDSLLALCLVADGLINGPRLLARSVLWIVSGLYLVFGASLISNIASGGPADWRFMLTVLSWSLYLAIRAARRH